MANSTKVIKAKDWHLIDNSLALSLPKNPSAIAFVEGFLFSAPPRIIKILIKLVPFIFDYFSNFKHEQTKFHRNNPNWYYFSKI